MSDSDDLMFDSTAGPPREEVEEEECQVTLEPEEEFSSQKIPFSEFHHHQIVSEDQDIARQRTLKRSLSDGTDPHHGNLLNDSMSLKKSRLLSEFNQLQILYDEEREFAAELGLSLEDERQYTGSLLSALEREKEYSASICKELALEKSLNSQLRRALRDEKDQGVRMNQMLRQLQTSYEDLGEENQQLKERLKKSKEMDLKLESIERQVKQGLDHGEISLKSLSDAYSCFSNALSLLANSSSK